MFTCVTGPSQRIAYAPPRGCCNGQLGPHSPRIGIAGARGRPDFEAEGPLEKELHATENPGAGVREHGGRSSEVGNDESGSWSRSTQGARACRSPWEDPSPAPRKCSEISATADRWQVSIPSGDKDNDAVGPIRLGGRRGGGEGSRWKRGLHVAQTKDNRLIPESLPILPAPTTSATKVREVGLRVIISQVKVQVGDEDHLGCSCLQKLTAPDERSALAGPEISSRRAHGFTNMTGRNTPLILG